LKSIVGAIEAYAHDRRGAYRPVRRWIAPSRFVREKAVELGADAARVRVLAHGVEPGAPGAPPRFADGSALPARFALYAGRLSEEKGVKLLPALARAIAPLPLVVAGGGPLERWLGERASGTLSLLGHLAPGPLAAVRTAAAVVVAPSLFPETFGYAVAEAQLDGRVVVASRIGALTELVEHESTGLLVPPGDDIALAEATRRALDEPGVASRWGESARARARTAFDPAAHTRGLIGVYDEAIHA